MTFHDWPVVPTSAEVFRVIVTEHAPLKPFSTFTDPTGTFMGGPGEEACIETVYGLDGADFPIVGVRSAFPLVDGRQAGEMTHEYFLIVAKRGDA